jgi:hypothetical protein
MNPTWSQPREASMVSASFEFHAAGKIALDVRIAEARTSAEIYKHEYLFYGG